MSRCFKSFVIAGAKLKWSLHDGPHVGTSVLEDLLRRTRLWDVSSDSSPSEKDGGSIMGALRGLTRQASGFVDAATSYYSTGRTPLLGVANRHP